MHPNPIPGQTYSVALLAKWNLSKSAETVDVHARKIPAIIGEMRNMVTNVKGSNPLRRETGNSKEEVSTTLNELQACDYAQG